MGILGGRDSESAARQWEAALKRQDSQTLVLLQAEECRAWAEELFRGNCKKPQTREGRVTSLVSMATYLLFTTVSSLNIAKGCPSV